MRTILISALLLVGCGGNDFRTLFGEPSNEFGDADALGSGGAPGSKPSETGGVPDEADGDIGGANPGGETLSTGGASDEDAGNMGGVGGCALVRHSNGVGQTWEDCAPLATYDAHEAARACIAYTGNQNDCYYSPGCGGAQYVVQGFGPSNESYLWGYDASTAGFVGTGSNCPSPATGVRWR